MNTSRGQYRWHILAAQHLCPVCCASIVREKCVSHGCLNVETHIYIPYQKRSDEVTGCFAKAFWDVQCACRKDVSEFGTTVGHSTVVPCIIRARVRSFVPLVNGNRAVSISKSIICPEQLLPKQNGWRTAKASHPKTPHVNRLTVRLTCQALRRHVTESPCRKHNQLNIQTSRQGMPTTYRPFQTNSWCSSVLPSRQYRNRLEQCAHLLPPSNFLAV